MRLVQHELVFNGGWLCVAGLAAAAVPVAGAAGAAVLGADPNPAPGNASRINNYIRDLL